MKLKQEMKPNAVDVASVEGTNGLHMTVVTLGFMRTVQIFSP